MAGAAKVFLTGLLVLVALAMLACTGDERSLDAEDGASVLVSSIDNLFLPERLHIEEGATVIWRNDGRNEHNVIPVNGGDWGVPPADFQPRDSYSYVFAEAGTYRYYCSIHGTEEAGMVGVIEVVGS